MLQQVMEYVHNYFIRESHTDTFTIEEGMISLPFLKENQRFLIDGSDLNDGVFTYHAEGIKNDDDTKAAGLLDETFAGTISALAVPPAVIALSGEINEWVENYGDVVKNPYTSESVLGEYNYQKAMTSVQEGTPILGWQEMFAQSLNRWRKVAFL